MARLMRGEGIRAKVVTHSSYTLPLAAHTVTRQFTMAHPVRAWHAPHRHLAEQGLCRELFRNTHASSCGLPGVYGIGGRSVLRTEGGMRWAGSS